MVQYTEWTLAVHEIKGKMDRGELIPDPDWQRDYIWNIKDEQLLIDSILRGLPIPKFYLTEEYNEEKGVSIHYVVDGQQRLKAIHKFLSNKFPISLDDKQYFFRDLDNTRQKKITTYKLSGHYLEDFTQSDINFLFKRLNSTGIKLNNIECWNNKYTGTNIFKMIKEIGNRYIDFYKDIVYTEENIKRMIPLDDIIDLCNCLSKNSVVSGSKSSLEIFLSNNKNISDTQANKLKLKFKKVVGNIQKILSKQELEASLFSKRTHFTSLFLAVGLLISDYYLLSQPDELREDLLNFIQSPNEEYKDSVLGAIRHKAKRELRTNILKEIILKYAVRLDEKRTFDNSIKRQLWRDYNKICQICKKEIRSFKAATVDHIIPWAIGGTTTPDNAQIAHRKCNQQKRDKLDFLVD